MHGDLTSTLSNKWHRLPKRKATAGRRMVVTSEEEIAAAPDVRLDVGSSTARATPAREDKATAATTTTTLKTLPDAMVLGMVMSLTLHGFVHWNQDWRGGVVVFWRDEQHMLLPPTLNICHHFYTNFDHLSYLKN
jgi:hypothetical protein